MITQQVYFHHIATFTITDADDYDALLQIQTHYPKADSYLEIDDTKAVLTLDITRFNDGIQSLI